MCIRDRCQTVEPYVSYPYEVTAQNARILKRLEVKDVAVDQVRVVDVYKRQVRNLPTLNT